MPNPLDVVLLLALPASGKSEVRRYLDHLGGPTLRTDMHLGPTAQLDDYPYVHIMRRISQELRSMDRPPAFFESDDSAWNEPRDWVTLINLVNDDFEAMSGSGRATEPAVDLLRRIDTARVATGAPSPFDGLDPSEFDQLAEALADDAAALDAIEPAGPDHTIVIEFARGGPAGAELPLPYPLGYQASIGALSPAILERSAVLYVWVEPEESRRRNRDRAIPGPEGDASILHHGVPERVMFDEYGVDDMTWLASSARIPGTIPIGDYDIPFSRFDNRVDRTSFLRADPADWPDDAVAALHRDLSAALTHLATVG